jgi:hypothetical protein
MRREQAVRPRRESAVAEVLPASLLLTVAQFQTSTRVADVEADLWVGPRPCAHPHDSEFFERVDLAVGDADGPRIALALHPGALDELAV